MKYFIIVLLFAVAALTACNTDNNGNNGTGAGTGTGTETAPTVRIAAMRGPTALGLLNLMNLSDNGETELDYEFTLLGSPDQVPPLLVQGNVDVAVIPANLASILYNNDGLDVAALAIVTLGVLHIVDATGEINSVHDLRGRTIYASGQGATPEFALNYVLEQNGLTPGVDVYVEFRAEHTELAALLEAGLAEIALLPEPFATTVVNRVDGLEFALDLTVEWDNVQPDYSLIMSAVVVRREFLEAHPEIIRIFMSEYNDSITMFHQDIPATAELAVYYEIIGAVPIALQALPRTHVVFIYGEEMRSNLIGFFNVLYEANPGIIGGQVPANEFYFIP